MIKKTREELEKMPLNLLRNLDIKTLEEEQLVQEVINSKLKVAQPVVRFPHIVPDIKTAEQEKEWQAKIDKHNAAQAPVEAKIAEAEKTLGEMKDEVLSETAVVSAIVVPTVVTVDTHKGEIIKPFCDKCDSKGKFHKKDCPVKQNADIGTNSI